MEVEPESSISRQTRIADLEERLAKLDEEIRALSNDLQRTRRMMCNMAKRLTRCSDEHDEHHAQVRLFVHAVQCAAEQFLLRDASP